MRGNTVMLLIAIIIEYAWMCLYKLDSKYALGPKYAKILKILKIQNSVLNMRELEFWIYLGF